MIKFNLIVLILLSLAVNAESGFAQDEFIIMGVMQHSDIEGGCWYLQTKQHHKYELSATPEVLQTCHVIGRTLSLRVRKAPKLHSVCMIGEVVEVIQVLDSVIHPHNPPVYDRLVKGRVHRTKSGCWYVLATDKRRYELQTPIPKRFMRIGVRYNRNSKVIPGEEGQCGMDGVITISMLEPDMQPKQAKEKKDDPR